MAESSAQPNWDIDFERGAQAEIWVSSIRSALASGAVEVKADERAASTGNLYIEYECRRQGVYKPSGIQTTKATAWAFVIRKSEMMLVIETGLLRRLCETPGIQCKEEKDGSHPTKGYILPLVWLMRPVKAA